ncbi:HIT family protein [Niveibacterium sp. 24ML]|uniref:HIT family protein n=1 Tax=Niveibacterium sp. 24ML TaxID=2985512 RepID=UPI00226E477E|nr:HIT family protein [Niveibacterium sp. 24ML]MCX9157376.1 HIT family protein [Niveibacterium sp. 24ML]
MSHPPCELCATPGGTLLWQDDHCRVIQVADPHYPGFCRVVWNAHCAEMSDLDARDRAHLMHVVWATERAIRETMAPHKINLASLGNMVPHLHWHVIPRFADDRHFPQPIWGEPQRDGATHAAPASPDLLDALTRALAQS